jgi:hypothetical protein
MRKVKSGTGQGSASTCAAAGQVGGVAAVQFHLRSLFQVG